MQNAMTTLFDGISLAGVPLAFLWTAFVIELTPGPNMTYLAILSLSEGKKAGLVAVIGVALGLLIVGLLAAFGLAAIVAQSRFLYEVMRWGGVVYLLWLAYDIWRQHDANNADQKDNNNTLATYFQRGLITNLLNPKAAVFYLAILPPFTDATKPLLAQTLSLSVSYVIVATCVHAAIVLLAAQARTTLTNSAQVTLINKILSLSLGAVALWLAWTTRLT
jgi:threonine/homoserine/homoserine lactone efflux protein